MLVRPIKRLQIWGRSEAKGSALMQDLQVAHPNIDIGMVNDLPLAVAQAEVIVTATGAKEPVIRVEWIRPGQHITSVGSDDTTKCELDPVILRDADTYVDAIDSATKYGASSRAIAEGLITTSKLTEIGSLSEPVTIVETNVTVACLSGLGVQDLTAINGFWPKLRHKN